jgi:hypothetical protein
MRDDRIGAFILRRVALGVPRVDALAIEIRTIAIDVERRDPHVPNRSRTSTSASSSAATRV